MLVLSRKVGQEIRLVEAGVTIRVASSTSTKVQLAVDAPRELTVLRGELETDDQTASSSRSAKSAVERLIAWAESVDASQLSDQMPQVDELIERLLELRLAAIQHDEPKPVVIAFDELAATGVVRQPSVGYAARRCC